MSLLTKLRFKPSTPVHVMGDSDGTEIIDIEDGYSFLKELPAKGGTPVQQVLLFARDSTSMEKDFAALAPHLAAGAVIWIAYPKKSGAISTDLNRDKGWKVVYEAGFVGVSQASLNNDWSALWFKRADALKKHLRATPMEDRVTEGVDYKARTVTLPADATDALVAIPDLKDFFYSLSFSHKREWAEAIADAKKPETRARRITRMVDDLQKQQAAKAAKTTAKQKT